MAPTPGTHPRRKATTYGKRLRSSLPGCRNTRSNDSVSQVGSSSHLFEGNVPSEIRKDGFAISSSLRGHCYPIAKNQVDLTVERGVEEECLPPKEASKNISETKGERGGTGYDVPLSGKEQDYVFRGDRSKKKRKTRRILIGESTAIAYNDDKRHIAAEVDQNNYIPPSPISLSLTRYRASTRVHAKTLDLTSRVIPEESKRVSPETNTAFPGYGELWRTNTGPSLTEHGITSEPDGCCSAGETSDCRSRIRTAGVPLVRPATPPQVPRSTTSGLTMPCHLPRQYPKADLEEFSSPSNIDIRNLQIAHLPQSSTKTQIFRDMKDNCGQYEDACPVVLKALRTKLVDKLHRTSNCANQAIKCDLRDEKLERKDGAFHVAQPYGVQHGGTLTKDNFSGSDSQSSRTKTQDAPRTNTSKPAPGIHGGSLKVTYARQRSYLTEDDVSNTAMFSVPLNPDFTSNSSLTNVRKIKVAAEAQPSGYRNLEMSGSEDCQSGAIRSIHELREAGGNARLVGEMEAIVEDINNISCIPLSLQRSCLLELAMKLQKSSFCRSFVERGLESRLLACIGFCPDTIFNMLLMVSFIYILAEPCLPHTFDLMNSQRIVDYLGGYLNITDDLVSTASSRLSNMSKARQLDISKLYDSLSESSAWSSGRPLQVTARNLSLQCLEYLVQHVREAGCTSDTLSQSITIALVNLMVPCIPHSISGPPASTVAEFVLAVSILESMTASCAAINSVETVWTSESITKMAYLLPIIQTWSGEGIKRLRTLVLRLSLNLTNNNLLPCEAFSKPEMISATMTIIVSSFHHLSSELPENNQMEVLDNLVLALGLLINLAEWSKIARELFVTTRIGGNTLLDTLIHLFKANSATVSEVLLLLNQL